MRPPYLNSPLSDTFLWFLIGILILFGAAFAWAEGPTTVLPTTGVPTYVHPPSTPSGPTTIITPSGQPVYVHPPSTPDGPSVVIPPSGAPAYIYPGK